MTRTALIGAALLLFGGTSCSRPQEPVLNVPKEWKELRAGAAFTLYAPPGTTFRPEQGEDSFVGHFDGTNFTITFDYGAYSDHLSAEAADNRFRVEHFGVGGQPALFVVGPSLGQYGCGPEKEVAAEFVQGAGKSPIGLQNLLSISACMDSEKQTETVRSIFRTIRFSN
jgi:hypothetical protein